MRIFSKVFSLALVLLAIGAVSAFAGNGAPPEKTDGFVCPVLGGQAGIHGNAPDDVIVPIFGGDFTVVGPSVRVPVHATNDNGAGSPGGSHASPGDADYTAIWAG